MKTSCFHCGKTNFGLFTNELCLIMWMSWFDCKPSKNKPTAWLERGARLTESTCRPVAWIGKRCFPNRPTNRCDVLGSNPTQYGRSRWSVFPTGLLTDAHFGEGTEECLLLVLAEFDIGQKGRSMV